LLLVYPSPTSDLFGTIVLGAAVALHLWRVQRGVSPRV
jgi:hypothetical protein